MNNKVAQILDYMSQRVHLRKIEAKAKWVTAALVGLYIVITALAFLNS